MISNSVGEWHPPTIARTAELLKHLPLDTGMGFVIVQHLAPERVSSLAGILLRATKIPVCEVGDEPEIEPDHIRITFVNRSKTIGAARGRARRTGGVRPANF